MKMEDIVRKYANSFYKTVKTGWKELTENNLHYPITLASCLTFLDTFTTAKGGESGLLREVNPVNLYIQDCLNISISETMTISAALGFGALALSGAIDLANRSKNFDSEYSSDKLLKKLYELDSYPVTKLVCLVRITSAGAGFASASYGLFF